MAGLSISIRRCDEFVPLGGGYTGTCRHPAKAEEGGKWWCGVHLPSARQARHERREKAQDAKARDLAAIVQQNGEMLALARLAMRAARGQAAWEDVRCKADAVWAMLVKSQARSDL